MYDVDVQNGGELDDWGRPPGHPDYGNPPNERPGFGVPDWSWGDPGYDPNNPPPDAMPYSPSFGRAPEDPPPPTEGMPPPPPPAPGPSSNTSGGGGDFSGSPSFDWPTFTAPPLPTIAPFASSQAPYQYSPFAEPEPFSFEGFSAPSLEQAQNEPGYEFARREGIRGLENAYSARGTGRTGGTIKDFINWGNKFAEQNYGNVYNRAANTYGINRGNAFDNFTTNRNNQFQTHQTNELGKVGAWNTNFGADKDTFDRNTGLQFDLYDRNFQGKLAEFNPKFRASELNFADLFNRWKAGLDATTSLATAGAMS